MYDDLYDALADLDPSQIKVELKRDGEHSVSLNRLCSDGMTEVLRHLTDEMELGSEDVLKMVPQLKNVKVTDLLVSALNGEGLDFNSLVFGDSNTSASSSSSGEPRVGDIYTYTRKVVGVYLNSITYEEDNGKHTNVLRSSFKGWAKNKRKS